MKRKYSYIFLILLRICTLSNAANLLNTYNENNIFYIDNIKNKKPIYYKNPIIHDYVYHDSSFIKDKNGYFYSFASSIVPRDTSKHFNYYTVSIFKSRDLIHWTFYKTAFAPQYITNKYITNYDKRNKINGLFSYHNKYYPIWAPEIIKYKKKYLLFVSLRKNYNDSKIAVFESDNLINDFKLKNIIASTNRNDIGAYVKSKELIDPFPIIDKNGKLYLVYGSFSRNQFGKQDKRRDKIGVYITELDSDSSYRIKGKPIFLTDYYEGVIIYPHQNKYYLFGSNGAWRKSTYQISYAVANNITGPYQNDKGLLINDTLHYNSGKVILYSSPTNRFNGFGCMTKPVVDKNSNYWVMLNGHDLMRSPIVEKDAIQERYTFLTKLLWNAKGEPYFENHTISTDSIEVPQF